VVRGAVSHRQVAHCRAVVVAERRRRWPQQHGWVAQRAAAGRGGPGGADAGRAFITVSVSSASVRRPASGVRCGQCPRVPVHATAVQRPVRASERPGVRCPAWASDVRGFRIRGVRPGCGREGGGGAGSRMAGMAKVGVVAHRVHDWLVVCPGRNLAVEAGAGRAGLAGASAWTGRRRGRRLGSGKVDHVANQERPAAREDRPLVGKPGVRSEVATTLRGHRGRLRAGSPGRREPPGLECDLGLRPCCGRSMQRAPPARGWRRPDLRGWGWR
jgi:hypothetical protein